MDRRRKQKLRGEAIPSDVQKVIVGEEHHQEWSSSLDQEDTKPPHINEEQEELPIRQGEEQLQGPEEADITKFYVPMKSEDEEENSRFSQLHQRQTEEMKTEADGEDSGGSEPARNSDPDTHLQPDTDDKTGDSSESKTYDSNCWKETRESQSDLFVGNSHPTRSPLRPRQTDQTADPRQKRQLGVISLPELKNPQKCLGTPQSDKM
ncbi:nestin-like isoform X3 [Perca fluviatilis]|uniref:nestin-like isoform X3 n=1 Tax=Perca fluviatilis TaxID=8168 RepID=UPI0019648213|nr:nestin-like isoform X3 [Perca fluviatilis]